MARLVDKQNVEDVDEALGLAYRYWVLVVETRYRRFRARSTSTSWNTADIAVSPRPFDDEQHGDLRAVAQYLAENEGVERLVVIGDSGGFDELEHVIAQKRERAVRDG